MKINEVAQPDLDLTIANSVTGSFRGGHDGVLIAKTPAGIVGYLGYSIYNDVPAIKMIEVHPEFRRHKIAAELLKALQELSPNEEIDWGYTTDDGSRLKQSINFVRRPNPEIIKKKEKLTAVKSKLQQLNYKLENLRDKNPEMAKKFINSVSDKWNKLNDLEYRLENELSYGQREYSNLIPESGKMKPVKVTGREKPGAVDKLKTQLLAAKGAGKKLDYDSIDAMMQRICGQHNLTGDRLHDDFVDETGIIPDNWIKKQKTVEETAKYLGPTTPVKVNKQGKQTALMTHSFGSS
jgi:hypothetical protein